MLQHHPSWCTTAAHCTRQVSSFDLVNRDKQFSYKVRRLGEFRAGTALLGAAAASGQQPGGGHAQAHAHVGGSELAGAGLAGFGGGDGSDESLDVEDPLYGNWGGEEEQVRTEAWETGGGHIKP